MSPALALKRVRRELQHWREAGEGPEVSWTKRGLEIAIRELCSLAKEERLRIKERRPRPFVERWLAADLYRAVRSAHSDLDQGKRDRAMRTLAKTIDFVREKQAV